MSLDASCADTHDRIFSSDTPVPCPYQPSLFSNSTWTCLQSTIDVIREGGKEEERRKLGFKNKIGFTFSTKEIALQLSTSPCKDLNLDSKSLSFHK